MRYHILKPTAPIYTAYTTLLTLYPLQVIKKFACNTPCKKVTLKFCTPAKKAKNRPKIGKNSNLKVDALSHSSTDSTHVYSEYYLGIPLSIAAIKNYFG